MHHISQLFDGLSEDECNAMVKCFDSKEKSFSQGEMILDFSCSKKNVGILIDGSAYLVRVDIDGNRYILETLNSGNVFGEVLAFSSYGGDSIFVECLTPCKVLFFEYDHVTKRCENACKHHSIFVQNMLKLISDKLIAMSIRVEVLSNRTIRQKLMCYFNICVTSSGNSTFELPFSISALADYIAADRSAVMRELKNMKNEGLVETERRKIKLL